MRITSILLLAFLGYTAAGQKNIEETFSLEGKKEVDLSFKWPKLVRIQNWDGNTIKISGTVLINNGENNDAFRLRSKLLDNQVVITSDIKNIDDLPKKIMIKRDGMSYYFNTQNWDDPEVQKFLNNEGHRANEYVTMGVIKEIQLDVYLPKGVSVVVNAKYGLVEVNNIVNTIDVNAKYGGIDMAFGTDKKKLEAKTRYGEIYSDLPFDLESNQRDFHRYDKWTIVSYKEGTGKAMLESKYGDVFLRQKRGG